LYISEINDAKRLFQTSEDILIKKMFNLNCAIVEVAVATRKMTFRYSGLCGMSSDAVDAVRSAIPMGFKF